MASRDPNLNPIFIRVTYEADQGGEQIFRFTARTLRSSRRVGWSWAEPSSRVTIPSATTASTASTPQSSSSPQTFLIGEAAQVKVQVWMALRDGLSCAIRKEDGQPHVSITATQGIKLSATRLQFFLQAAPRAEPRPRKINSTTCWLARPLSPSRLKITVIVRDFGSTWSTPSPNQAAPGTGWTLQFRKRGTCQRVHGGRDAQRCHQPARQ